MRDAQHLVGVERVVVGGAVAGIVGALLGMVGNLAHQATPSGDPEAMARVIAGRTAWVPLHLVILVGLILMLGGLAAVSESIPAGPGRSLARLGRLAAVAGVTVGVVLVILDGVSAKHHAWAAAPADERPVALGLVVAVESMTFAIVALFNILFAGVTFLLYGLAVVRSRTYPAVTGWIIVASAVGSTVVGLIQAYLGESSTLTQTLGIIFPTVITAWLVWACVVLLRRWPAGVQGA